MEKDIRAARKTGLAVVVIGPQRRTGGWISKRLTALIKAAGPMDITLHRAFDMVPNFTEALKEAASLGIKRILTSAVRHQPPMRFLSCNN